VGGKSGLYLTGFHRGRAQLSIKQGFIHKRGGVVHDSIVRGFMSEGDQSPEIAIQAFTYNRGMSGRKRNPGFYWLGFHEGEGQNLRFSTKQGFSRILVFWVLQTWDARLFQGLFGRVPFSMGKRGKTKVSFGQGFTCGGGRGEYHDVVNGDICCTSESDMREG
jgi:hypothetical protein